MISLFDRFGSRGAPQAGERGFRAFSRPAGALGGQDVAELARGLYARSLSLLDDDLAWELLDPFWVARWTGGELLGDQLEDQEESDLADLLGVPLRGVDGQRAPERVRSDFAHELLELAAQTRDELAPSFVGTLKEGSRFLHGGQLPSWAAVAVIHDRLTPTRKLRLVNVSKEVARDFIEKHHSALPYLNARGLMYALGVMKGDRLVAVATAGHPTGAGWSHGKRGIDARNIVELTRVASDGTVRGASSKLVARLLDILEGSRRGDDGPALFITYQLASEAGTTYKALQDKGLRPVKLCRGKAKPTGSRKGSTRALHAIHKIRWEAGPAAMVPAWELLDNQPKMKEVA